MPKASPVAPRDSSELQALSFEQILEKLEGVVEQLEEGEVPLEQALATFEQGVALSRLGQKRLDEAERRIELLLQDEPGSGGVQTRPLGTDEAGEDDE
jgi:exodeoxyribonuclease VII small subunit